MLTFSKDITPFHQKRPTGRDPSCREFYMEKYAYNVGREEMEVTWSFSFHLNQKNVGFHRWHCWKAKKSGQKDKTRVISWNVKWLFVENTSWVHRLAHLPQKTPRPLSVAYMIGGRVRVHIADQTQRALCRLVARLAWDSGGKDAQNNDSDFDEDFARIHLASNGSFSEEMAK